MLLNDNEITQIATKTISTVLLPSKCITYQNSKVIRGVENIEIDGDIYPNYHVKKAYVWMYAYILI